MRASLSRSTHERQATSRLYRGKDVGHANSLGKYGEAQCMQTRSADCEERFPQQNWVESVGRQNAIRLLIPQFSVDSDWTSRHKLTDSNG